MSTHHSFCLTFWRPCYRNSSFFKAKESEESEESEEREKKIRK